MAVAPQMRLDAQDDKYRSTCRQACMEEERAARRRYRASQRLQRAASRARGKKWRQRVADAIIDTRRPPYEGCTCDLRFDMTRQELRDLGAGCTAGRWVCPRLDAVRRKLGL